MEQRIRELLSKGIPEIDFCSSEELVDDGILDSLSLMTVIGLLNKEFDIEISFNELTEDNFNSIKGMAAMITRLQKEK